MSAKRYGWLGESVSEMLEAELFFADLLGESRSDGGSGEGTFAEQSDESELFYAELMGQTVHDARQADDARYPLGSEEVIEALNGEDVVWETTCTCTHTSRKYATANVPTRDLIGTRATIKTHYGKVCCEGSSRSVGVKATWTGVTKTSGTMVWAQTGYGRQRARGSASARNDRYYEIHGSRYHIHYDTTTPPSNGSTHTYQCEVDNTTGQWTFTYDGTAWGTYTDAGWVGTTGTRADYTGEIYNDNDDMSGTSSNKCTFRDCKKKSSGGSWVDAGLSSSNVTSSNSSQWGATRVSNSGMDIWDKHPNP